MVESYRADEGPRRRVLRNLAKLSIHREKWKLSANRIEEIMNGQNALFEIEPEIESFANHYANLLIRKKLNQYNKPEKGEKNSPRLI